MISYIQWGSQIFKIIIIFEKFFAASLIWLVLFVFLLHLKGLLDKTSAAKQ